ncbi:2-succinylbenzoate-CoA ligase [Coccomyxa sp. Obi]|nr:2-succinylbenzoate-CoA ligase [Coccomyxa sp. Obi]
MCRLSHIRPVLLAYLLISSSHEYRSPSKIATVCQGREKTAQEVQWRIATLSRALTDNYGLKKGDRVALLACNTDLFFEAFMAVLAAGGIAVPINLRWSSSEAQASVHSVGARILFMDEDVVAQFGGLAREDGRQCIILGASMQTAASEAGLPEDGTCCHVGDLIRQGAGECPLDIQTAKDGAAMICFTSGTAGAPRGAVLSHAALHTQALAKLIVVGYRREDVYLHCAPLYHIGGMSSMLAVLAAGGTQVFQPVFSAASTLDLIKAHNVTSFIAVPAMVVSLTEAMRRGAASQAGTIKLLDSDASSSVGSTQQSTLAPALATTQYPAQGHTSRRATSSALTSVKRVLLGGGELPAHLQRRLQLLFPGACCMTAYGMTEACSSITFRPIQLEAPTFSNHTASGSSIERGTASDVGVCVGDPPPGIEVAVMRIDPAAESASGWSTEAGWSRPEIVTVPGEVGEVLTRGPHIMLRYWNDSYASARALLPGGWLRTGDLGALDAGGALWLLGRLKDVVRSGSENVHAATVERALLQIPGVAGAAVVGLPHDRLGEQVSAIVVLHANVEWSGGELRSSTICRDSAGDGCLKSLVPSRDKLVLSSESVNSMCRSSGLSAFMLPRIILAQYSALPTNSSGKVLKHVVREQLIQWLSARKQTQSKL